MSLYGMALDFTCQEQRDFPSFAAHKMVLRSASYAAGKRALICLAIARAHHALAMRLVVSAFFSKSAECEWFNHLTPKTDAEKCLIDR